MKKEYSAHPALASEQLQRAEEQAAAAQHQDSNCKKNPLMLLAKHRRHRLSGHAVAAAVAAANISKFSQSTSSANTTDAVSALTFTRSSNVDHPFIAFADVDANEADDELAVFDDDDEADNNTNITTKDCVDFAPSAPPIESSVHRNDDDADELQQRLSRIQHISEQYCQRLPYQRRDLSHHRVETVAATYIAQTPVALTASSDCSLSVCSSTISTPSASTVSSPLSTPTHYVPPQQLQHSHRHCCQHVKTTYTTPLESAASAAAVAVTATTCTQQSKKLPQQKISNAAVLPAVQLSSASGCKKAQKFDTSFGSSPYRQLFPIVLCVLSFATVFSLLIIYMDTTEIRHQQFRLNMSRDSDFNGVAQDDPTLVAFLREIQMRKYPMHFLKNGNTALLAPMVTAADGRLGQRHAAALNFSAHSAELTPQMAHYVANLVGGKMNGAVIQSLPGQLGRLMTAPWLVETLNWAGLIVEPEPRRFFTLRKENALRSRLQLVHACVSPNPYPKEVTIHNEEAEVRINSLLDEETSWFNSRVKCFPLYTIMLAYERVEYDLLSLGVQHGHELEILQTLPFDKIRIEVISIHLPEDRDEPNGYIPSITKFLIGKSYKMQKKFGHNYFYQRLNATLLTGTTARVTSRSTSTSVATTTKTITQVPTLITKTTTLATRTRKKDILLLKTL